MGEKKLVVSSSTVNTVLFQGKKQNVFLCVEGNVTVLVIRAFKVAAHPKHCQRTRQDPDSAVSSHRRCLQKKKCKNWFAWYRQWKTQRFLQCCWQILCLSSPSLVAAMMPLICIFLLVFFFALLTILPHFILFNAYSLPPLPSVLQVQMLESLSWLKQKESRKAREREREIKEEQKREEKEEIEEERIKRRKVWILEERGERKETGTMGRKKIQITRIMDERNRQVSPWGGWRMDEYESEGERRTGGGRKEKHPTPLHSPQQWRSSGSLGNMWTGKQEGVWRENTVIGFTERVGAVGLFVFRLTNQREHNKNIFHTQQKWSEDIWTLTFFLALLCCQMDTAHTQLKRPSHTQGPHTICHPSLCASGRLPRRGW